MASIRLVIFVLFLTASAAFAQTPPGKPPFDDKGPQVGGQVPNLEIRTLENDPRELQSAINRRLTVLLTASYTCPKSRSTYPDVRALQAKYNDDVQFIVLYIIEAHPQTDICPYTGKEEVTDENIREGILRRQPKTLEERVKLAMEFRRSQQVTADMYLDTMENPLWKNLGGGPNMAFLLDSNGIVLLRQGWLDAAKLPTSIDAALKAQQNAPKFEGYEKTFKDMGLEDLQIWAVLRTLQNGPVPDAQALLEKHPKLINWQVPSMKGVSGGRTLLGHVVEGGKSELAELLIEKGADVNGRGDEGMTPLHAAAIGGKVAMIDLLLKHGAKIDAQFRSGAGVDFGPTPLDEALMAGKSEAADRLVKAGAKISFWANVGLRRLDEVQKALVRDATLANLPDGSERTPLMYAAVNGQSEIARVLIKQGAVLNHPRHGRAEPALAWAVRYGQLETARVLLDAGADPNAMSVQFYDAPINLIREGGERMTFYKMLIEHKADLGATDVSGYAPIHKAVMNGDTALFELLIAASADLNEKTANDRAPCGSGHGEGTSVLQLAVKAGSASMVKRLIAKGASLNQEDAQGHTAMDVAEKDQILAILSAAGGKYGSGKSKRSNGGGGGRGGGGGLFGGDQ